VQTTHKIGGDAAAGFASYLTATTRGDYYLAATSEPSLAGAHAGAPARGGAAAKATAATATATREPTPGTASPEGETPSGGREGKWHGSREALAELGLSHDRAVSRGELLALMHGESPATGEPIRAAGGNGTRVAGVDLTFSAPKSVSALWAVSSSYRQAQIEAAHGKAVAGAMGRVERDVELMRTRKDGGLRYERAKSVVAAEFVHTSSRLTSEQERGGVPDPQLHSHVVVLAGERLDGRFGAVESRELFRAARANGAWYRAELTHHLSKLGLEVQGGTGRDGRYFELKGVPGALSERWSARAADIAQAARDFRSRYGREPRAGELGALTVATRGSKTSAPQTDVAAAWRAVGAEHGLTRAQAESLFETRQRTASPDREALERDVLANVTRTRSMLARRDVQARAYELAAGVAHPREADAALASLAREGELIPLQGGVWTTRELREREQRTVALASARAQERAAPVRQAALRDSERETERALAAPLSSEQREALATLTGEGGMTVLVGQAGTGKGVVLGTAARAWQREGYEVVGTAVAGATAQRLQADANLTRSMTTDSLIGKAESGSMPLDSKTVVVMDEAGMADTNRLARVAELTARSESKLVLVGDSAQLSAIGAGGLFKELQEKAPSAELTEVHRARHAWERKAWGEIRNGEATRALAAYEARDRLHIADTREQAARQMVQAWDESRAQHGTNNVVMLSDASNAELDRINVLAQQHRAQKGELGAERVQVSDRPYGLASGDQIIFTAPHHRPGERRVENGTLATITDTAKDGTLTVQTREQTPRELNVDTKEFTDLKLAYAQHVYKAQGLTVDHAHVLTGGWQTDRERAYVAVTRAREQTDIYATRQDLGEQGMDTGAIERLAQTMTESHAQQASITRAEANTNQPAFTPDRDDSPTSDHTPAERTPDSDPRESDSEAARVMRESQTQQHERDHGIDL
jgi:conjugative relaxase-like TrwC/TraI family protein